MCNDYRTRVDLATIGQEFNDLRIPLRFPEGRPNLEPREDIRITDRAPILRWAGARRSSFSAAGAGPARAGSRSTTTVRTAVSSVQAGA
jgi:putative SOS response-associated peptidase YedK